MNVGLGIVKTGFSKVKKAALAGVTGAGVLLSGCGNSVEKGALKIGQTAKTDVFQISTKEAGKIISAPNFDTTNIQKITLEKPKSSFIMTPKTVTVERKPIVNGIDTIQETQHIIKEGWGQHRGSYPEVELKSNGVLSNDKTSTLGYFSFGLENGVGRKIQTPIDLKPGAYASEKGKKATTDTSYFKYNKNHFNQTETQTPINKASYDSAMTSLRK